MGGKNLTIFHISVTSAFNISGAKLIYYTSSLFNPRLLLPSPPPQSLFATIKSHSRCIIKFKPPFKSVIFSQSFRETNAADLFFGLRYAKPNSLNSIFTYMCCHARWPSIHTSSQFLRRLVVHETNATVLFVGLWYVKPKKLTSIFDLMRLHAWPEFGRRSMCRQRLLSIVILTLTSQCLLLALFISKKVCFCIYFLKHKLLIFQPLDHFIYTCHSSILKLRKLVVLKLEVIISHVYISNQIF